MSSFCRIKVSGTLSIGRDASITNGTCIAASGNGIEIGDPSRGVKIGNNVWLGAGVVVLDGAVIGVGAIVAPNSVMASRLPANTISQGNPARVIFTRR